MLSSQENSSSFVVNMVAKRQAMTVAGKYFLHNHLLSLKLQAPSIDGYTRKEAIASTNVATKEHASLPYLMLPNDALLAFDVTLIAPIVYTSHQHELMALQNNRPMALSTDFTVYANLSTIESTETSFLGQEIDLASLHNLIKLFWKESSKERTSEKWKTQKGQYLVYAGKDNKNKALWVAYQIAPNKPAAMPESENLAPIVDETPKTFVTDISIAWNQAYQENKARAKIAKQEAMKSAMNS